MLLIIALGFIYSFCVSIAVISLYYRLKNQAERCLEYDKQMNLMAQELRSLMSADIVFNKSVAELNHQLLSLDERFTGLENQRSNDAAYNHALKILNMGGDKDEIIDSCNLSNAEAELLSNLNAYQTLSTEK